MTQDASVSVVIPYYNSDSVFDECVASVFAQTRQPDEVVVVDDGSRESSRLFLSNYSGKCRIITLSKNSGVAAARNVGVQECTGDFVAFLDSDDKWAVNKLEEQVGYLAAYPECDAVHTGVVVFNKEKILAEYLSKPTPLTLQDLLKSSHVTPPSFMVRRSAFLELGGYDVSFRSSEDYEFSIRFVQAGKRIDFLPLPLTYVRREGHGNLSSKWLKVYLGHLKVVWRHRQLYRTHLGKGAAKFQMAKHTVRAGQHRGGIFGRLIACFGKLLAFPRSI